MKEAVLEHFRQVDPTMSELLQKIGAPDLPRPRAVSQLCESLCEAIVSQQLSVKAADTIFKRFKALLENNVTPKNIAKVSDQELREAGLSFQKISYVRAIAEAIEGGGLTLTVLRKYQMRRLSRA